MFRTWSSRLPRPEGGERGLGQLIAAADTLPGGGCLNPLSDPRDGTQARLVRSWVRYGDYAVPEGRYGVEEGELLRLECNTGQVVGVVRR